jgi:hypothetical protein
MRRPVQPPQFHRLTPAVLLIALALGLAITSLPLRNTLQAQELAGAAVRSVSQMDSLFRTRYNPEINPGKGTGWKPFSRMEWFYGQRAYPTGEIPAGARMTAWQERESTRRRDNTFDESWSSVGPSNFGGRILSIAWHPTNTAIIYAGSASGGLWKTTNSGTSWTALTDDLPTLAVGTVALDPSDANVVYIGTGEGSYNIDAVYGSGIFKSTDGGSSWNTTGMSWTQSEGRAINKIVVHPTDPLILWAATNISSSGGVYKSTDGGATWTRTLLGDAKELVMHPDSANVLYTALGYAWGGSGNGIYRSSDGGLTWTAVSSGLPAGSTMGRMSLSISHSSPQTLYTGIATTIPAGSSLLGIYKTTNCGASWTLQASTPNFYNGQGWYNNVCEVHPTNPAIVFSSGLDCYKSTNSGVSWTQKTYWSLTPGNAQYAHADHHALAFKPGDPNTIIVATDGGLSKSTNGGDTWTEINNGLVTFQFYAMGNDLLNSIVAYGGTQDNGSDKYTGSSSWTSVYGGDGGYCNVDYTNSNIVYVETQRGSHYKSTNGGSTFSPIQTGITGNGAWVTPFVIDPSSPTTLYTATTMVYKSTNGGTSWTAISSALSSSYISTIAVAPSNTQVIYAGCETNGQIWKTTDGGGAWSSVSTGIPYRYITRLAVHPTNANLVYATVSGYGSGHVWKSTNGGTSWTNSSSGLPDLPCNVMVIDQSNPSQLYAGTDLGVYSSTDAGASWTAFSAGLPNVVVDDLALHPATGVLRAATHGRGMWQTSTGASNIAMASPNGGETWVIGSSQTVLWSTGGLGGTVNVQVNRAYPGGTWESIAAGTSNDGSQAWTVTGSASSTARIRVLSVENSAVGDTSSGHFSIAQPSLTLTSPVGGVTWVAGDTNLISWTLNGISGSVVVQINRSYPSASWTTLATTASPGYSWVVSAPASSTARIRAYLLTDPTVGDTCAANFSLVEPALALTTPNGGESLTPGAIHVIRWVRQNYSGTVKLEINNAYPGGTWDVIRTGISGDSLAWVVGSTGTSAARIRVTATTYAAATDLSSANFSIRTPTLAVTYPNGGEIWSIGTSYTVRWTRANLSGPVNVYVNRSYPTGDWVPIGINVSVDTLAWTVLEPYSSSARVRVGSVNLPSYYDESNANFVLGTGLIMTAPNGGESWAVGTAQTIAFTRYNAAGNVTVQVNRTYPTGTWETLSTAVSTSSYAWTVNGPGSTTARVRVFLTASPTIGDTSNANFLIPAPFLVVNAPNGTENWTTGSTQNVTWTRGSATGNVTVEVNRNYPSGSWETLTTTAAANSFAWTVTTPNTATARMRIFLTASPGVGDTSNANFTISTTSLTLTAPNGGEAWVIGTLQKIRWTRSNASGNVAVLINRTYPTGTWTTLTTSASSDSFSWTVTSPASAATRIRIYLVSNSALSDTSAGNFSLLTPSITVTSPNGGESWVLGQPQTITFTRSNADGDATVQVNRTYPTGTWETISTVASGTSLAWTPTGNAATAARVRVFLNSIPAARDSSNASFALLRPTITVSSPNGGESWAVGTTQNITWARSNAPGPVTVQLNRAYSGGTWETLTSAVSDDTFAWPVSGAGSTLARVRVYLNTDPSIRDSSNANFTITQPTLTLTTPDGGGTYTVGAPVTVRWTRSAAAGAVSVLLNRNYPSDVWETLTSSVTADTFAWVTSGNPSTTCRIKVRMNADTTVADVSSSDFTLIQRTLTITGPNGGETIYTGYVTPITFTRSNATANVTVQLNRNFPAGSWETLTTTLALSTFNWTVSGAVSNNARIRVFLTGETYVGDTCDASFVIVTPSLVLQTPNGGEQWTVGTTQTVSWLRNGVTDNVRVELKRSYPSGAWEQLAASVAGTSYSWTVSGSVSTAARMRVISATNSAYADTSAAMFSLVSQQVTLTNPNGGDSLAIGLPHTFRWTRVSAAGDVRVELNRAYPGGNWEILGSTTADSLVWTVAGATSSQTRARITLLSVPAVADTSAANFVIYQPDLSFITPAGGDRWLSGRSYTIFWQRTGFSGTVRLDLNTNYPGGSWTILSSGNSGFSHTLNLPLVQTAHARFRLVAESQPLFGDTSGEISIENPILHVSSPNGGEVMVVGNSYSLQFTATNHADPFSVQVNRNYPSGIWETLIASTTSTSVSWTAAGANTATARLRVVSSVFPAVGDTSDANFSILTPGVHLWSPVGGDILWSGNTSTIRWTRTDVAAVNVRLNRNYPSGGWETLASNLSADSLQWIVSGALSSSCRIRVSAVGADTVYSESAANFSIQMPVLSLMGPAAGDTIAIGYTNVIRWTRNAGVTGNVRVELNRTYPAGSWTTIGTASGDSLSWVATAPASTTARIRIAAISNPAVGDTLDGNFTVALVSLVLNSPMTGPFTVGQVVPIAWTRAGVRSGVNVYLSRNFINGPWETLATNVVADSWNWTVIAPRSSVATIRIVSGQISGLADTSNSFVVLDPALSLTEPNSGTLGAGNSQSITWTRTDFSGLVSVEWNSTYPSGTWETVATGQSGTSFSWTVPSALTTHGRIRVRSESSAIEDISDADLSIVTPALTVLDPNGGEVLNIGEAATLSWNRTVAPGGVRVELNRNYPSGSWETLGTDITANSLSWTVNGDFTHGRIRVSLMNRAEITDISNGDFGTRVPELYLTHPNGGDTLIIGQPFTVRFSRNGVSGPVKIELNRTYPSGSWETLSVGTSADSLNWTVSGAEASAARIRVTLNSDPAYFDESDADCRIARQAILFMSPAPGDSIALGMPVQFSWNVIGVPLNLSLYVKRIWSSGTWELLSSGLTGNSWTWTAAGSASETARFRLISNVYPSVSDTTDGPVRIGQPTFVYVEPHAADTFLVGEQVTLKWSRQFAAGNVHVELSRGGTGGPWEDLGTTSGDSLVWNVSGAASNIVRFRLTLVDASWVALMTTFNCRIAVPTLNVTAPAAGLTQAIGRDMTMAWSKTNLTVPMNVYLQRSAESELELLRSNVAADSMHWTASGPAATEARITVRTASGFSVEAQSGAFAIGTPALTMVSPAGGAYVTNATLNLRWSRSFMADPVRVELNRDYPAGAWTVLSASVSDTQMNWPVSGLTTYTARFRVTSTVEPNLSAVSAANIQLLAPTLVMTTLGRSVVPIGFPILLSWERTAVSDALNLYLSRDGGATWPDLVASGLVDDTLTWIPNEPATQQARLKIVNPANPAVYSISDIFDLALPQLSLAYPVGGETIALGSSLVVRWSMQNHPAAVRVELNRNYPAGLWETLADDVEADSFEWIVSGSASMNARVRIVSRQSSSFFSESQNFSILGAAVQITSPLANAEIIADDSITVAWERTAYAAAVKVSLRRAGSDPEILNGSVTGNSLRVPLPAPAADSSWIVVEDAASGTPRDSVQIRGPFAPQIRITAPVSGDVWFAGQTYTLRFTRIHANGPITVQMNRNYPLGSWETIATTGNDSAVVSLSGFESNNLGFRAFLADRPSVVDSVSGIQLMIPVLTILNPEQTRYRVGSAMPVTWHCTDMSAAVRLELNRSYPAGSWETLYQGPDTAFVWTVAGDTTHTARLRAVCVSGLASDTLEVDLTLYQSGLDLVLNRDSDTLFVGHTVSLGIDLVNSTSSVNVALQREPDGTWETVFSNLDPGLHDWTVTGPTAAAARLKVFVPGDAELADTSEPFAIMNPALQFSNSFAAQYTSGDHVMAEWSPLGTHGPYRLLLLRNAMVETLAVHLTSSSYDWTVTPPSASVARFILEDESSSLRDSSSVFALHAPALAFVWPATEGTDTAGTAVTIRWQWTDGSGAVNLEIARDAAAEIWEPVASAITETQYDWQVAGPETNTLHYRITSADNPEIFTVSVERQLVVPALQLNVAGGTWYIGQPQWIHWSRQHYSGAVALEMTAGDRALPWQQIAQSASDSFLWTVSGVPSDLVALRVTALDYPAVTDTTDIPLRVAVPFVQIVAPNGGDTLQVGDPVRLRWRSEGITGEVGIGLWRGAPINDFDTLFTATENDSSEIWTITGPGAAGCYLILVSLDDTSRWDTSDARFVISGGTPVDPDPQQLPGEFALEAPYPNPFNSMATIEFALPKPGKVRLVIYDVLGREVEMLVNDERLAGRYRVSWNAGKVSSGTYFLRMDSAEFVATRKLNLVK